MSITGRSLRTNPDRNQHLIPKLRPGVGCPPMSRACWARIRSIDGIDPPSRVPHARLDSLCAFSTYSIRSVTVLDYPFASGRWPVIFATNTACHLDRPAAIGRMTYSSSYASPTQYDVAPSRSAPKGRSDMRKRMFRVFRSCAKRPHPVGWECPKDTELSGYSNETRRTRGQNPT